jgi:alpha-L-fucosidase
MNKTSIRLKLLILIVGASFFITCKNLQKTKEITSESVGIEDTFDPTWESLEKAKPAKWWDEGKFGIFIHWGPYSVAGYKDGHKGYSEAITNDMYKRPEKYKEFFIKKFGAAPPEFGYKDWVKLYTAENWNPQAWAQLFKESGARYVIPTAEHHDGFVNWDSDLTEWSATKMGPMRDLVGDLGKAVRAEGLKYGLSYHRERHPSRFANGFHVKETPFPQILEEIKKDPSAANLYGPFEYSDAFITDYVARWKEMETKYQPDFMWIDDVPLFYKAAGEPQTIKFQNAFKGMIADYLNVAKKWGKEVYFNNKGKHLNFPAEIGCIEKDNLLFEEISERRYQNPATMGVSYAYMENEEVNELYKTPAELVRLLCDVVSKNGNLLLNIGPKADGTIPKGMQTRLKAIGAWLKVHGEAIYKTTPWKIYGEYEGAIIEEKDVVYTNHSMHIHKNEVRYTSNGNYVYASIFQKTSETVFTAFKDIENVKSVEILGDNNIRVRFEKTPEGLKVSHDANANFSLVRVYKIELLK